MIEGTKDDNRKLKLSRVPPELIEAVARVRDFGDRKYTDPENWKHIAPERWHEALLRHVLARGKTLCLPRCGPEGSMDLCRVDTLEQLAPGTYGILEPVENCPLLEAEDIDFVVTPCLSCDRQGNRLGQGGGYYDRFFARYHGPAALLCREKLVSEEIPVEPHDKRFELIVTENAVYRI